MNPSTLVAEQTNATGFERECEKLRPLGEAYVLRRFGGQLNHADAEDAVADVLIRLHQRARSGATPDNLRAAFFTSVRNAAIDQLRARGARPTVALESAKQMPGDGVTPSEYAEGREEGAMLNEVLASMRRNYREAILLRFGVGLTVPEIAKRQGIGVEGAKKVVLRATRQVKQGLLDVTSSSHCEEMQGRAKRHLFDKYAAQVATEQEAAQLERHLEHCGRCKSVLVNLHHSLHDLATGALVSTAVSDQLSSKVGIADHLGGWIDRAAEPSHFVSEKVRVGAFKLGNAVQGGEAAAGGAIVGTGQKIVAVCSVAGVAAASCVGAGVVGPGISIGEETPVENPGLEQTVAEPPSGAVVSEPSAEEESQSTSTQTVEAPAPQQEFGFEASSAPSGGSGSGGNEFAAPSGGGGAGGSSGAGNAFSFEK